MKNKNAVLGMMLALTIPYTGSVPAAPREIKAPEPRDPPKGDGPESKAAARRRKQMSKV